jgi:hypothetical protein
MSLSVGVGAGGEGRRGGDEATDPYRGTTIGIFRPRVQPSNPQSLFGDEAIGSWGVSAAESPVRRG